MIGFFNRFANILSDESRSFLVGDITQEYEKLITADTRDCIALASHSLQTTRDVTE